MERFIQIHIWCLVVWIVDVLYINKMTFSQYYSVRVLWFSLANASQAVQCWAVSTGPSRGHQALMPPLWNLFLTVGSETCISASSWRCLRALAVHKGADTVLLLGRCPSVTLSSYPRVTASILAPSVLSSLRFKNNFLLNLISSWLLGLCS